MLCGFGERVITPEPGSGIPGYFENRINTGALEPLFAKAVVFEQGDTLCALTVLDAIQADRSDVLDIRRKAMEMCGIAPENVFVWATHTHTGGPVDGNMNGVREKDYIDFMTTQAARAIRDACETRRPARIGSGTGEVLGTAFIRRFIRRDGSAVMNPSPDDPDILSPEGTPDETYTVARIEDAQTGEILGFLSSFGLHLDTVGGTLSCADYPAQLANKIREKYGENVKSIFFTGPCGNTNHFDMNDPSTRDGSTIRFRIAENLFRELCRLNEEITCSESDVGILSRRFLLPLRNVTSADVAWAQDIMSGVKNDYYDERFQLDIFAKPILDISRRVEQTVEMEIGGVRLGDLTVLSWPGEVFVEFGRAVRQAIPGENIIIGELSGGSVVCYICTEEAHRRGSYEPMAVSTLCLEPSAGTRMVEETLRMLKA